MSGPQRIRLSRAKGWRMPENTVKVDRSTKWGNPFNGDVQLRAVVDGEDVYLDCMIGAADAFRLWLDGKLRINRLYERRLVILNSLSELRGKNLACWCIDRPGAACHADVLLELANGERTPPPAAMIPRALAEDEDNRVSTPAIPASHRSLAS